MRIVLECWGSCLFSFYGFLALGVLLFRGEGVILEPNRLAVDE